MSRSSHRSGLKLIKSAGHIVGNFIQKKLVYLLKHEKGFIAAWGGVMVLDGVIFFLTLNKAIHMRRVGFTGFLDVMLRDGEKQEFSVKISLLIYAFQAPCILRMLILLIHTQRLTNRTQSLDHVKPGKLTELRGKRLDFAPCYLT